MPPQQFVDGPSPAPFVPLAFVCSWRNWGADAGWVHVAGELDLAAAPRLAQTLEEALAHARLVVLDLRELTFMDSAALHAIVQANVRARHDGRRLMVVRGGRQVQRLFALTGIGHALEILDMDPGEQPARLREEVVTRAERP